VYLYNLPEVASAFKYIRVPGVSARFGTDPFIWNWAMWLVARLCPPQFLQDRSQVRPVMFVWGSPVFLGYNVVSGPCGWLRACAPHSSCRTGAR
jgi:hypothetical protein